MDRTSVDTDVGMLRRVALAGRKHAMGMRYTAATTFGRWERATATFRCVTKLRISRFSLWNSGSFRVADERFHQGEADQQVPVPGPGRGAHRASLRVTGR